MKDCFAILGQPRRPWLDADAVRTTFMSRAADSHPDRFHQAPSPDQAAAHQQYTALNDAQHCLTDTRTRLRHFLELERGGRVTDLQEIPEDLMELFSQLAAQLRATDRFLETWNAASSPLLKANLFNEGETHRAAIQALMASIREKARVVENSVREVDSAWGESGPADAVTRDHLLTQLESLYRITSFQDRWTQQLQSRATDLLP